MLGFFSDSGAAAPGPRRAGGRSTPFSSPPNPRWGLRLSRFPGKRGESLVVIGSFDRFIAFLWSAPSHLARDTHLNPGRHKPNIHDCDVCDIFLLTDSDFRRMLCPFAEKDPES